jgi:hypothetical protein
MIITSPTGATRLSARGTGLVLFTAGREVLVDLVEIPPNAALERRR